MEAFCLSFVFNCVARISISFKDFRDRKSLPTEFLKSLVYYYSSYAKLKIDESYRCKTMDDTAKKAAGLLWDFYRDPLLSLTLLSLNILNQKS